MQQMRNPDPLNRLSISGARANNATSTWLVGSCDTYLENTAKNQAAHLRFF